MILNGCPRSPIAWNILGGNVYCRQHIGYTRRASDPWISMHALSNNMKAPCKSHHRHLNTCPARANWTPLLLTALSLCHRPEWVSVHLNTYICLPNIANLPVVYFKWKKQSYPLRYLSFSFLSIQKYKISMQNRDSRSSLLVIIVFCSQPLGCRRFSTSRAVASACFLASDLAGRQKVVAAQGNNSGVVSSQYVAFDILLKADISAAQLFGQN